MSETTSIVDSNQVILGLFKLIGLSQELSVALTWIVGIAAPTVFIAAVIGLRMMLQSASGRRKDQGRNWLIEKLERIGKFSSFYHRWVDFLLKKIDWFAGDNSYATYVKHSDIKTNTNETNTNETNTNEINTSQTNHIPAWHSFFTLQLFERCLILAVLYPMLFMLFGWVFSGNATLGNTTLIAVDNLPVRVGAFIWLILSIGSVFFAFAQSNGISIKTGIAQSFLMILAIVTVVLSIAFGDDIGAFAFALAFALAVAFAGARTYTFARAFAYTFAYTFARAFAFAVAVAFAFAVAGAGAFADAVAVAGFPAGAFGIVFATFAFSVAVAFAAMILKKYAIQNQSTTTRRYLLLGYLAILYLLGLVFPAIGFGFATRSVPEENAVIFAFLALLPLCNALFDWLSLGASRWLLARGLHHNTSLAMRLGLSLLDLAIALLTLCALVGTISLLLYGYDVILGEHAPFINYESLLISIKLQHWSDNFWILAIVITTLLPTITHLCIATLAVLVWPLKLLGNIAATMQYTLRMPNGPSDSYITQLAPVLIPSCLFLAPALLLLAVARLLPIPFFFENLGELLFNIARAFYGL